MTTKAKLAFAALSFFAGIIFYRTVVRRIIFYFTGEPHLFYLLKKLDKFDESYAKKSKLTVALLILFALFVFATVFVFAPVVVKIYFPCGIIIGFLTHNESFYLTRDNAYDEANRFLKDPNSASSVSMCISKEVTTDIFDDTASFYDKFLYSIKSEALPSIVIGLLIPSLCSTYFHFPANAIESPFADTHYSTTYDITIQSKKTAGYPVEAKAEIFACYVESDGKYYYDINTIYVPGDYDEFPVIEGSLSDAGQQKIFDSNYYTETDGTRWTVKVHSPLGKTITYILIKVFLWCLVCLLTIKSAYRSKRKREIEEFINENYWQLKELQSKPQENR